MNSFSLVLFCAALLLAFVGAQGKFQHYFGMSYEEVNRLGQCITKPGNEAQCNELLAKCFPLKAKKVVELYDQCNKEFNPEKNTKCKKDKPLYENTEVMTKIEECMDDKLDKPLTDQEKQQQIQFQECVKDMATKNNCN